jgi:hypothetical protein
LLKQFFAKIEAFSTQRAGMSEMLREGGNVPFRML